MNGLGAKLGVKIVLGPEGDPAPYTILTGSTL